MRSMRMRHRGPTHRGTEARRNGTLRRRGTEIKWVDELGALGALGASVCRVWPTYLRASVPRCIAIFMLASSAIGLAQQPQQSQPQAVFRSTTRLIVQNVTVKDKEGKPIEGLTAKDFTITEDGMPQDIAFVEFQRLQATPVQVVDAAAQTQAPEPIAARPTQTPAAPAPAVQTQITTPPRGGIKYQDKRLIVMYFDGSSMGGADGLRAYVNARKYIDTQMSPSDLIAIMAFQNGAVSVKTDFTAD